MYAGSMSKKKGKKSDCRMHATDGKGRGAGIDNIDQISEETSNPREFDACTRFLYAMQYDR